MQKNDYYNKKNDQGKTDWSLLPWKAIESAARIMTIAIAPKEQGGKGYGLASWRDVPEGFFRYEAALIRHFFKRFICGEIIDPESGEPHTAHMICNAGFVYEKDREWKEEDKYDANFYERKQQKKDEAQKAWHEIYKDYIPHDIDYTEAFKNTTYEDNIRQMEFAFDYTKPSQEKETYCTKCGVTYNNYLRDTLPIQCIHTWDIRDIHAKK